jgi:hypothetical protein
LSSFEKPLRCNIHHLKYSTECFSIHKILLPLAQSKFRILSSSQKEMSYQLAEILFFEGQQRFISKEEQSMGK